MREWIWAGCGWLIFFLVQGALRDPTQAKAKVLYCHDGDTCQIKTVDGLWLNVRLGGVDAPEIHKQRHKAQKFSFEARDFLNQQLKGRDVALKQSDLDVFNRPIVEITLGEKNINLALVEAGLAESYKGKTKRLDKQKFLAAEEVAKRAKRGIWSDPDYLSPKEYRAKNRKGKTWF